MKPTDPCEEMAFINYQHNFVERLKSSFGYRFTFVLPTTAKIIAQSQEVDAHSLIGNIGGYIGLFLGKKFSDIYDIALKLFLF